MTNDPVRCARHPDETTSLSCSRCGTPVCVRCMVHTPVGIRCRSCAKPTRSGISAPGARNILKAAGAGLPVALAGGLLWGLFPAFAFWIALLVGFAGGELVNLAASRKRGPELMIVAAGTVVLALGIAFVLSSARGAPFGGQVVFMTLTAALALVLSVVRQR